uniref:FHOD1 N-terminal GTPase-binding domain-containing protein n=1 Tax=Seriola dumerili TaxID=41447 RepID=A0A3B4TVC7_SERDU
MASITCRLQYLEDSDPFICTNFPEPRRPPTLNVEENLPLSEQIAGIHKLLEAPLKLEECTLQLSPNGNYLDLDSSLAEQRDELESFYEDVAKGKKPILILRTQLSVRVHSILGNYLLLFFPWLRRCVLSCSGDESGETFLSLCPHSHHSDVSLGPLRVSSLSLRLSTEQQKNNQLSLLLMKSESVRVSSVNMLLTSSNDLVR